MFFMWSNEHGDLDYEQGLFQIFFNLANARSSSLHFAYHKLRHTARRTLCEGVTSATLPRSWECTVADVEPYGSGGIVMWTMLEEVFFTTVYDGMTGLIVQFSMACHIFFFYLQESLFTRNLLK